MASEETIIKSEEEVPLNTKTTSKPSRFQSFKKNVTVEPAAILFLSSSVLCAIATQTLNIEKACLVNLDLGEEICTSLRLQTNNHSQHERTVQEYIAARLAWKSALQSLIPCLIIPFAGAWSDKTGRRVILIALPIIGEILQCISNILNVIFFYQLPVEVLMFFEAFLPAITGGWTTLFLAVYSFISDITSEEKRTYRMGIVHLSIYIGVPIGSSVSGILLKYFGYYAVFGTALFMQSISLIYVTLMLKDPHRSQGHNHLDNLGSCATLREFFDFTNLKETVRVVFKNGPNRRRLRISVLLSVVSILFGPMYGEISVMYLSTRYRFNWDEVKFSLFQTYNFMTHTAGTIFSILVLSKHLKWHDTVLGIVSTVSKIAASFVYCFAPNERIFYLAPLIEILNGTSLLAMRSIISKLVSTDELGKVNSIFGLTENLMPLLYVPLYTRVYTATMDVLPGFVFLMGAMMTVPAVAVFTWLLYEHRKEVKKTKKEQQLED